MYEPFWLLLDFVVYIYITLVNNQKLLNIICSSSSLSLFYLHLLLFTLNFFILWWFLWWLWWFLWWFLWWLLSLFYMRLILILDFFFFLYLWYLSFNLSLNILPLDIWEHLFWWYQSMYNIICKEQIDFSWENDIWTQNLTKDFFTLYLIKLSWYIKIEFLNLFRLVKEFLS